MAGWLAFGSLDFLIGQVLGKGVGLIIALPAVYWPAPSERIHL